MAFWGTSAPGEQAVGLGLRTSPSTVAFTLATLLPRDGSLVCADVPALLVPVAEAVRVLATLPDGPDASASGLGESVHAWAVATKLALEHVIAGHLVPVLRAGEPQRAIAHWRADPGGDPRLEALAEALPGAAHALRVDVTSDLAEGTLRTWAPRALLAAFCDAIADVCARAAGEPTGTAATDVWPQAWLNALTSPAAEAVLPVADGTVLERLSAWAGAATAKRMVARLCLRLELPRQADAPWPLTFHLQPVDALDLLLPAQRVWTAESSALTVGTSVLDRPHEALTEGIARAARCFPPVAAGLRQSRPTQVELTVHQVAELIGAGSTALHTAGIGLIIPDELSADGNALGPCLIVGSGRAGTGGRTVGFRWEAVVGDEVLTSDEVAAFAARGEPLARWRDRWVWVDCDRVDDLAALAGRTGRLTMTEALSVALCGRHRSDEFGEVPARVGGTVVELLTRLRESGTGKEPDLTGVRAELRGYQRRGVAWLQSLTELGFGALLADDMGLGKTLQAIALLAAGPGGRPRLVVCPTSVMSNWERELARFAPGLAVLRHHGTRRARTAAEFAPGMVVVTSYALLRLDAQLLTSVDWDLVLLDEAQQVKNHNAQTARVAVGLTARAKVALTGTPVENRLSELWSIMHVVNPGLLGSHRRFKTRFADPIERKGDPQAAESLKNIVAPFVLRRVKGAVLHELPAKLESTVLCNLTGEQAALYRVAVAKVFDTDDGLGTGFARHGNVLRLLTELKQICNHPVQYLRKGADGGTERLAGRSGKLARATEMLGEVVAAGDSALVFTQYRVMGELLVRHLSTELGLEHIPFLHGATPAERRDQMVDDFQRSDSASALLVVSLKAGGFGLNLTRASHVLHYDRWWNPAVEDQATDRAHRMGQTRTVHVHKLVTADTFEERIDALLRSKRSLAESVVGSSETWLAELDDAALRALVQLADSGDDE